MSFFDLIEKEEVFLNEYLLFQKNRAYDKYTNEIQRFFKVKKVTSRKTFYTQPHDITFLQNTFIDLDSRKDKKYYYFMYNSDWSPNQQKMILHNSQHISKYFCLNDEICQRLIDLKSTIDTNIFSLKGDLNMLKYISKLEENGITYSQQNLDDYFEAFIQQSFDVYTPIKYRQTLTSIPPTVCKQVVILYVPETKPLTKSEINIQLQSFLQQKNVVLWFTPFQNIFKILNSLEISNKAVLLLSTGMEVLSNGVDKMFHMLNTEPELKYVNSYFKDDFKWYSYGHEYGFLNLYYNYTPPFMMVKIEDGNIPVFKHSDFKVNIWEYSISLANQGKCGYTMSECLVKCSGNMFPEGNRMHSLITKIRKKYPKVYTEPLEYPFVDRKYSNGEIITDKYKNCEYEPDYRHYGLTQRDFILQMLEDIKPPFSHPKNKKLENNNVIINKRNMNETIHDKIFIALPTFNRGEKCIQVIQNVMDQKYTDWKLYVIDDGSEKIHGDEIKQFLEKCDKKYDIEYFRNDTNLKLPKTLNVSIQQFLKSDCEYFTWVSDDNEYYHNFLEDLYCEISKENIDFVYSGWDENIEGTSEIRYKNPTYNCFEDVLNKWDGMASFMWTKQMISQIGWYNIDIHGGEDYDYILRLFLFTKNVSNLDKSTMKYIVNSTGSISSDIKLCQQIKFSILEFYNNLNISFNLSNTQQKSFIYYSTISWTKLFQRPHQIMRFMSKDYFKVFLTSENIFTFEDKYSLWIIPNKYKHFVINFFKDSIIYFTDTRLYYEIIDNKTQNSKLLYDLIDAPIDEFSVWKNNLDVCVKNSDYVIYSHPKLIEFLQDIDKSKKYTYISNACDVEHFSKAQHRIGEYPSEFPKTDKKILGYYGSFSRWLDFNLIKKYADGDEYHIVMIGGLSENNEYNVRIEHKNITWIDHQSYEKLPYYLSWFDVCFMPFKKCQLNEYVNPCKLWEYLACKKDIIKHNININSTDIISYDKVCLNLRKNINCDQSILLVLDNYYEGGLEKHTDILQENLNNCDVMVFNNTSKYHQKLNNNYINYDIVIWQNIFYEIPCKKNNQKYIYIVHSNCDWWSEHQKEIVVCNDKMIDMYIYVSDNVKNTFEKNILKPKNGIIIENSLSQIENNKKEIPGLFISSGSYTKNKGHLKLIQEFYKINNNKNTLEIYGNIEDKEYYSQLNFFINTNNITNIKLYEYTNNYLERLKEAEYFCLFSNSEGCSYSMLEAIALNKKIICTTECLSMNMKEYPNIRHCFETFECIKGKKTSNYNMITLYEFLINNIRYNIIPTTISFKLFKNINNKECPITIITPCYNSNIVYLKELKKSLYDSSYKNWLWIIINDGSSNNRINIYLNEIVKEENNIIVYSHYKNYGLPHARNTGWDIAKSKYIFFIDDDDLINENCIKKSYDFLEKNKQFSFVNYYYQTFNNKKEILQKYQYNNNRSFLNLYENGFTSCFMIRRDIPIRFDNKLVNGCEDWDFFINCIHNNVYGYTIEEQLFLYRTNKNHNRKWKFSNEFMINKYKSLYNNPKNYPYIEKYNIYNLKDLEYNKDMYNITEDEYFKQINKYLKFPIPYRFKENVLTTSVFGGLGNQLFMIFNILSLQKDNNIKKIIINYNRKIQETENKINNLKRESPYEFQFFNHLISDEHINCDNSFTEEEFRYNKIYLDKNYSYNITGFFQSYKYFWHNNNYIKNQINIDNNKITEISKIYGNFNKKIIGIHVRRGDYVKKKEFHGLIALKYYEMVLNQIDLNEYQIILFSDNIQEASSFINQLGVSFITANSVLNNTIDHFYMLMLCDIIICANSTFSLMACFMNEIFKLKKKSKYFVPCQWFGKTGPSYNIYDIVPSNNDKFKIVFFNYKCAVIFFHKNIKDLYKERWIQKCVDSILRQKLVYFDIFEINYGNTDYSVCKHKNNRKYFFYKKDYATHTEAMTFLLDKCFLEHDYDYVFNTNMDDYYDTYRCYYQLKDIIINNNFINSSLWYYITENKNTDNLLCKGNNKIIYTGTDLQWVHTDTFNKCVNECTKPISYDLINGLIKKLSNPINHSGVCFTKNFWNFSDNIAKLRYRADKPYEDISLWYRAILKNIQIGIVNKHLIFYRIHENQIGEKNKRKDELKEKEKQEFCKGPQLKEIISGKIIVIDNIQEITVDLNKDTDMIFICTNRDNYINVNEFLKDQNINCLLKSYSGNKNYHDIINLFDIEIESSCDKIMLEDRQQLIPIHDMIFYTVFYHIKSKFSVETYINWSLYFFESLKSYKVVIFTDQKSYQIIKHIVDKYTNIDIILKEITDFKYYKYIDIFQKNTSKTYFPNHDISKELILLWVNRHLFCSEIKKKYTFRFISYLDIGYFRDGITTINNINFKELNKYKIYFVLIKNEQKYIKNLINIYRNFTKEQIHNVLLDVTIAGGGYVLHSNLIDTWVEKFDNTFQQFKNLHVDFKDDQSIIFKIIADNRNYFHLINNSDWFYLKNFLVN